MVNRDGKRIDSRSQIRMQTRAPKRGQQHYPIPMQTGARIRLIHATEIPDTIGVASRVGTLFEPRVGWHMEGPIEERAWVRIHSRVAVRMTRQMGRRINSQVRQRIGSWAGTPLETWIDRPVGKPLAMRVDNPEIMRIAKRISRRAGPRIPTGSHKRVSIGCVSWTAIRMPSYYGGHDSARRDSARRHAEGRQR